MIWSFDDPDALKYATAGINDQQADHEEKITAWNSMKTKIVERITKNADTDFSDAVDLAEGDPSLVYETVNQLNQRDAFSENTYEQQYVDSFIESAKTQTPDYLSTDGFEGPPAPATMSTPSM